MRVGPSLIIAWPCNWLTAVLFVRLDWCDVTPTDEDDYLKVVDVVADVDVSDSLTTVPRQLNDRLTMLNTARWKFPAWNCLIINGFATAWRHLDNSFGLALQELGDSLITALLLFLLAQRLVLFSMIALLVIILILESVDLGKNTQSMHFGSVSWVRCAIAMPWRCFSFCLTCWLRNFLWSWPLVRSCISRQIETWSVVII